MFSLYQSVLASLNSNMGSGNKKRRKTSDKKTKKTRSLDIVSRYVIDLISDDDEPAQQIKESVKEANMRDAILQSKREQVQQEQAKKQLPILLQAALSSLESHNKVPCTSNGIPKQIKQNSSLETVQSLVKNLDHPPAHSTPKKTVTIDEHQANEFNEAQIISNPADSEITVTPQVSAAVKDLKVLSNGEAKESETVSCTLNSTQSTEFVMKPVADQSPAKPSMMVPARAAFRLSKSVADSIAAIPKLPKQAQMALVKNTETKYRDYG